MSARDKDERVSARKAEHLDTSTRDVESRAVPGWGDIHFAHDALPEIDLDELDLSVSFLGRRVAPIAIAGMTGGHDDALLVNTRLARAAARFGLAMGVGSQRAALHDPSLAYTYSVARDEAPDAFLIANVGAAQLIPQDGRKPAISREEARAAIDMIGADALAVHLNFLEEAIQPEGDRRARGVLEAIARIVEAVADVPVIVKETGSGMATATARRLAEVGVAVLDVGGRGGTSFAAIEARRAAARDDRRLSALGEAFRDWGIPTPVSILAAGRSGLPVIGTGGVRSGIDVAKAVALGATLAGVARPALQGALAGQDALDECIARMLAEYRLVLYLTGSTGAADLRTAPRIVSGATAAWIDQLGLDRHASDTEGENPAADRGRKGS